MSCAQVFSLTRGFAAVWNVLLQSFILKDRACKNGHKKSRHHKRRLTTQGMFARPVFKNEYLPTSSALCSKGAKFHCTSAESRSWSCNRLAYKIAYKLCFSFINIGNVEMCYAYVCKAFGG